MNCHDIQIQLSLYLYGELDFASEEALEQHLAECAFCQLAFAREKNWHTAATAEQRDVSLDLLSRCRQDLRAVIRTPDGLSQSRRGGWRSGNWGWPAWLRISPTRWSYQLALGSFLVFAGFFGGRMVDHVGPLGIGNFSAAGLGPSTRIRDIQPSGNGGVKIVFDQVNQRELVGSLDDRNVRRWLLVGVQDSVDPGIRVDSLEMLSGQTGDDVRDALLDRIAHDSNAAVRLKALESVRPFAADVATRNILRATLERDPDPAVRAEAIDVLAPVNQPMQLTPDLTGTIEDLARSEHDDYVRGRCLELLRAMHTPIGTY